ncbi:RHS repeat-associated core domain-containing protein, partial [Pseudoalteromonas luteoviolacea]
EHLDELELIHMNGRVYDYNLGRFMSVDPFIYDAGNSQAINPYSYGMNNPLSGTDPTGYIWETAWDIANVIYDIGKIGYGYSTGNAAMVADGFTDLAADAVAVATPFLPAGSTKLGRATIEGVEVANGATKGVSKVANGKTTDIGSQASKSKTETAEIDLNYKRNPKHDQAEFEKQASDQAKGLESQSAGEIKSNIENFREAGRKEANSAVAKYKKAEGNPSKGDHVTHKTDCCIGGKPTDISGTGNGPINSSIGKQNAAQSDKVYNSVKNVRSDAKVKVTVKIDDEVLKR